MGLESLLITIHVVAAIVIVGLVLLQRGRGADIGASFGSGASQTMFGSGGSGNFLTRVTTMLTVVFFATSLGLAIVAKQRADSAVQNDGLLSGDVQQINTEQQQGSASQEGRQQAPAEGDGDLPAVNEAPAGDVPQLESGEAQTDAEEN